MKTPQSVTEKSIQSRAVAWFEPDVIEWQRRQLAAAGGDPSAIADPVAPKFLRRREVQARTGLSCSTLYRWMEEGRFPRAIPIDRATPHRSAA